MKEGRRTTSSFQGEKELRGWYFEGGVEKGPKCTFDIGFVCLNLLDNEKGR